MPGVCHRCKRNVYVADEKIALGRVWHNFCVSCRKCRKLLDECSAKLYQDEIYCRKCYRVLCGECDDDGEERRCGGRRGGCCRRCPTPARIPARAKPSPTAVTTWYNRGHSAQPCTACPRCAAEEPWLVCEGGSQRCPDGIGCKRRSRSRCRSKPDTCDESCPARDSAESLSCSPEEETCPAATVKKKPCTCCRCCASERPRRKSCCRHCCRRCLQREKRDEDCESSSRGQRSCDRSTCCAYKCRQRSSSPDKDGDCESSSRGRRSCDRSTCCARKARRRTTSPCSTAEPPCIPCPPRRKTPDPPCSPCVPCDPCPPCSPCPPPRRKIADPPCAPCSPCPPPRRRTPDPPCAPCVPCKPRPPCTPCPLPRCKSPDPPCAPCGPCPLPRCKTPDPPCLPCMPCSPSPPCSPCPVKPPCRPCPAARDKADCVEVLCPPVDSCRCSCCCGRRRGRSCSSSDRASKASSCPPCPAAKPRCCCNSLPIGRPCRRCGRQVYHAELVLAAGTVFHTCCFSCRQCRKPLESTTVYEAQNEIFCKQCYLKRYGPSGYGYGLGAGALQTP